LKILVNIALAVELNEHKLYNTTIMQILTTPVYKKLC